MTLYLTGEPSSFSQQDAIPAQLNRMGFLLRRLQKAQDLDLLDFDNELDCAILGDAAYKVTWDPDLRRPEITPPDVTGLYAWWQPDNLCRLRRAASQYALGSQQISDLYGFIPIVIYPNLRKSHQFWGEPADIKPI